MSNTQALYDAVLAGKAAEAAEATRAALAEGADPQTLINDSMARAMEQIGARFEAGQAYVPNLLLSARAMKGALEILKPLLRGDASASAGKVVIGTVKGDLHDIGKNLVASMLEGCGFEVINIGVDVDCDKYIAAIEEHKADVLCMSALLTTTMDYMKEVIDALERAGLRSRVKVMVGGAPVSEAYAASIGADGFSSNANGAVTLARRLVARA